MLTRIFTVTAVFALALATVGLTACSEYQKDPDGNAQAEARMQLRQDAANEVQRYKDQDPSLDRFFSGAAGYAVFPEIASGAAGIGGAYGKGVLYVNGQFVGYCSMKQASIGAQIGGQTYSELVFFEKPYNVDQFKKGNVEFSAEATAVAASKGAAAKADYENGVAIFILGQKGLMAQAAIGGQKFTYWPE